jgi:hypothetical protein
MEHKSEDQSEVQDLSISSNPSHASCQFEMSALIPNSPISGDMNGGIASQIHNYKESNRTLRYYSPELGTGDHITLNPVSVSTEYEELQTSANLSLKNCVTNGNYLLNGNNATTGQSRHSRVEASIEETDVRIMGYSPSQYACVCKALQQSSDNNKLQEITRNVPQNHPMMRNEDVLRARAAVAFNNGQFKELYRILESHNFSQEHHKEMQELWNNAHYQELANTRNRALGAVDKYRSHRFRHV